MVAEDPHFPKKTPVPTTMQALAADLADLAAVPADPAAGSPAAVPGVPIDPADPAASFAGDAGSKPLSDDAAGLKFMGRLLWDQPKAATHALTAVAALVRRACRDVDVVRLAATFLERVLVMRCDIGEDGLVGVRALLDALVHSLPFGDATSASAVARVLSKYKQLNGFVGPFWTMEIVMDFKRLLRDNKDSVVVVRDIVDVFGVIVDQCGCLVPVIKDIFLAEVTFLGRCFETDMRLQGSIMRLYFKLSELLHKTVPVTKEVLQHALALLRKATPADDATNLAANVARLLVVARKQSDSGCVAVDLLPRPACFELSMLVLKHVCCTDGITFEFGRTVALDAVKLVCQQLSHEEADTAVAALETAAAVYPFDYKWHVKVREVLDPIKAARAALVEEGKYGEEVEGVAAKRVRVAE